MNKKAILYLVYLFIAFFVFVQYSCKYEEIQPADASSLPDTVSYANDIIPIWNASCNMSGCHNSGGVAPDLSVEFGYMVLSSDESMVDTTNPAESKLYKRMVDKSKPMPPAGLLSESQTMLVLKWIEQGALNN